MTITINPNIPLFDGAVLRYNEDEGWFDPVSYSNFGDVQMEFSGEDKENQIMLHGENSKYIKPSDVKLDEVPRILDTTLDDDSAISITPPKTPGVILVTSGYGTAYGLVRYNLTMPAAMLYFSGLAFDATTGQLTGTTGADGKITASAHTDGNIYIENRTGARRAVSVLFL